MTQQPVRFKVFRLKQGQERARYETFTVPADRRTTVLVALQEIRRTQDPSLTLRHSCHHASCGTCGMRVNGQEVLACVTGVQDLGTEEVVVEPLNNAPIISDLVVDMNPFFGRFTPPDMPLIRASEFNDGAPAPDGIAGFTRYENCLECGLCVSACPVMGSDPAYLGPAGMAAAGRVVDEPRGGDPAAALAWVDAAHGCWRCHVAYECSEVCPSNVDPGGAIMGLRRTLTGRKLRRLFRLGRAE